MKYKNIRIITLAYSGPCLSKPILGLFKQEEMTFKSSFMNEIYFLTKAYSVKSLFSRYKFDGVR